MQLELRHISKTFGPLKANRDINFTFEGGKIYAILGENGAGKSTLMKIISGYQPPDEGGQILLDGKPITIASPQDALYCGIGMLYQDPLTFPPMTVIENHVTAHPHYEMLPDYGRARQDIRSIAQRFGFPLNPDVLIETLTIGERQQLEIVRLQSLNVKMLILDEPTTGISAEQREQLFSTLKDLAHNDGLIIAIVTHKLADVQELCDEVMVLRHGVMTGTRTMPVPTAELVELMFGQSKPQTPRPPHTAGDPVLRVKDFTLRTPLLTIEDINLDVRQGEVIGLAGLDGSGQSAFMRYCAGLTRRSWQDYLMSALVMAAFVALFVYLFDYSATFFWIGLGLLAALLFAPLLAVGQADPVYFNGKPTRWFGYRDLRARGMAFLSAGRLEEGLVTGMSVMQHVALDSKLPWVNWWNARSRTRANIEQYDIRGQAASPIQTLSGGNQQRVALSLLPDNLKLAFLENPTRGLDVNSAANIWNLMLERCKGGTAIVFSSPDLDEIVAYSDRVLVFSSGRCTLVEDDINVHNLGHLIGGGDAKDSG
jgi:simple sugar transport system ATP-binding protein